MVQDASALTGSPSARADRGNRVRRVDACQSSANPAVGVVSDMIVDRRNGPFWRDDGADRRRTPAGRAGGGRRYKRVYEVIRRQNAIAMGSISDRQLSLATSRGLTTLEETLERQRGARAHCRNWWNTRSGRRKKGWSGWTLRATILSS